MNPNLDYLAPSLPPSILYPATALLIVVQLFVFWRVGQPIANFVIFAAWFRYIASAYHAVTFKPSFLGPSWNALGSLAVFILGLLLIRRRNLMRTFLLPFYLLIALVVVSGLANNEYSGIFNVAVKYGYFVVVTLSVFEALGRLGQRRFFPALLWAFALPLAFQALSIVLRIGKAGEADGSVSFIGGYNHEAAFSVVLVTCFVVACFADSLNWVLRNTILLACLIGIFFANYRTAIVAIAPIAVVQFAGDIIRRFRHDQRALVGVTALVCCVLGLLVASLFLERRFQDLAIVAESGGMIQPPSEFTWTEARVMSGRPYIWSKYIYGYVNGDTVQHLVGFGPESWMTAFPVYAHNTLISQLYEYGPLGVIGLLYFWFSMLIAGARVRDELRWKLLAAHASFVILNMATMALWLIEGNILYAIICGYTLHLLQEDRSGRRSAARPQGMWRTQGSNSARRTPGEAVHIGRGHKSVLPEKAQDVAKSRKAWS